MKEGKKSKFGPTGPWFRMPRELTQSSELNPYQYRMLSIMVERDDYHQSTKNKDRFWSYTGWLVSHSGMGRTKAKETLNELEKMGFITITNGKNKRRANIFHINWDFINAYKAPNTRDDELEDMEEPDIQEEPEVQEAVQPISVSMPPEGYETEAFDASEEEVPYDDAPDYPDEEVLEDYKTVMSVDEPEQSQESKEATIPTALEWYQLVGESVLIERYYPKLLLQTQLKDKTGFDSTIHDLLNWIYAELPGCDVRDLMDNYVGPGYNKYKEKKQDEKQV